MKKFDDLKRRIDELLNLAIEASRKNEGAFQESVQLKAEGLSFIEKIYGRQHSYFEEFKTCFEGGYSGHGSVTAAFAVGVLRAIKNEIDGGWLFSMKSLVSAEIFNDTLEMGEYFLNEGYKDAAAIMIGGALEGHLKQLCRANNIPLQGTNAKGAVYDTKADALNIELCKKQVYNETLRKQVSAWLGLRNDAAHALYGNYNHDQVKLMHDGVLSFIAAHPIQ